MQVMTLLSWKKIGNYINKITIKLIRLCTKSNASVTRNIGIKNSVGEIICFLDADDIWCENKLQVVSATFEKVGKEPLIAFHKSLRAPTMISKTESKDSS